MDPARFRPPLGLSRLFSGLPTEGWAAWANGVLLVSLLWLLVGWRTRWASLVVGLVLMVVLSRHFSVGKIDHNFMLVAVPLLMSGSGWGRRLSLDAWRVERAAPGTHGRATSMADPVENARALWLLALALALCMSTAGIAKVYSGWLSPANSSTLGHLARTLIESEASGGLAHGLIGVLPAWAWEAADWVTVVFELAFLPALLHRRAFQWVLSAAVVFHVGVLVMFGIVFSANLVAYAAFVRWSIVLPRSLRQPARQGRGLWAVLAVAGVAGVAGVVGLLGIDRWLRVGVMPDWVWLGISQSVFVVAVGVAVVWSVGWGWRRGTGPAGA